jgi:hypothetical protein
MGQQSVFLLTREVLRALERGKLPSPALFRQLLSKVGSALADCGQRPYKAPCGAAQHLERFEPEPAAPPRQALGYGIITAACVVKVPQISAIARAGSARGLSALSFELEQLGLSVNAANGFVLGLPFSAYGEALVLVLQNTVLLAQIYALSRAPLWRALLVATLFFGGGAAVLTGELSARELCRFTAQGVMQCGRT